MMTVSDLVKVGRPH